MKETKDKRFYEAPQLTVVTFKTERGYALSNGELSLFSSNPEYGNEDLEDRQDGGNWGGDGGWF